MHNEITSPRFEKLRRVIDLMRTFDQEVPGQLVSTFFYICARNGCNTSQMPKDLGLAQSSISRCTDWLSTHHRLGKEGMGLIVKKKDPADRRTRRLWLTPKGEIIKSQIEAILNDV